jgi:hypothetical protein
VGLTERGMIDQAPSRSLGYDKLGPHAYMSVERRRDPDKPRNLAKSIAVTLQENEREGES